MTFAIIVLGLALAISLAFNFGLFGGSSAPSAQAVSNTPRESVDDATRASKAENELEKKRKELDELKKTHADLKGELKDAKKKIFDAKESDKAGDDLVKARAEVERQASLQLETTRAELATALATVQQLRSDSEAKGRRPKPAAAATENAEAKREPEQPKQEIVVQRVIRELSEAEKEKMQRLELQSSQDKKKAIEIAAELRSIKGKVDREKREAKRIYEEGRLARDKFRAVEIRLNRTLLENDLLKRAITDLEKKTGQHAEHQAPTADELAQADASMTAKHVAEDKASADAQAKLEAAEATVAEAEAAAAAAPSPAEVAPPVTAAAPVIAEAPAPTASAPTA
ncbi:MAG: cell envelope biogenesis protein TolA [Archangium sp.]|nr:cell envelope biogenesis protein TolA [Archangium sp.]